MHFIKTLGASLLLAGSVVAQTSGSSIVVHVVAVASPERNTLSFSPQNVVAKPGEMVQFQFHNGNHTVTQSNFANPCVPINTVQSNVTGFHSGFQGVTQGATSIPTYTILVNNTAPIWFYCAQGRHCQEGMVGAVNAPTTGNRTMQTFVSLAAQAPASVVPDSNNSGAPAAGASSSASGSASTSTIASGSTETGASSTASSSAAVASGAASGSLFASPQQVLSGGIVAGLLAVLL